MFCGVSVYDKSDDDDDDDDDDDNYDDNDDCHSILKMILALPFR